MKFTFAQFAFRKIPKKRTFFGNLSEYMFPFRGYLFLSWHLTHRGGGRIFAVFWTSDAEKITIFWKSSLCGKKLRFFGRAKAFAQNNSKKRVFLGESSGIYFLSFFFFVVMFFYCAFWVVHDFRRTVRKNGIFSCPKNDVFSGEKERCFLAPAQGCGFCSLIICEDLRQKS